jgi:hypothetical protein
MSGMIGTPSDSSTSAVTRASSISSAKSLMQTLESFKSATVPLPASTDKPKSETISYELYYTPQIAADLSNSSLTQLESRITTLEAAIGTPFLASSGINSTLCDAVRNMTQTVDLLGREGSLDALSRRLAGVLEEFARVDEGWKRRHALAELDESGEDEAGKRVEYLYGLLDGFDSTASLIPMLITRLHALKELHTEAALFADGVKEVDEEVKGLADMCLSVGQGVEGMKESVTRNEGIVLGNVEALDGRIEKLLKRIETLNS